MFTKMLISFIAIVVLSGGVYAVCPGVVLYEPTGTYQNITFDWSDATEVDQYTIQVFLDEELIINEVVYESEYNTHLPGPGTYSWRLICGGQYSQTHYFTLQ